MQRVTDAVIAEIEKCCLGVVADPGTVSLAFPYQPGSIIQVDGESFRVARLDTKIEGNHADFDVRLVPLRPMVYSTFCIGDNIMDMPEGVDEGSRWSAYTRASLD